MRYKNEVIIDAPREKVVDLFRDADNLPRWQAGLARVEHVSGKPGEEGAVTDLIYQTNTREAALTETVLINHLPEEYSAVYETRGVRNLHKNYFYEDGPGKTRYVTDTKFEFRGLMRLLSFFVRGALRRQTLDDMLRFKAFVESVRQPVD